MRRIPEIEGQAVRWAAAAFAVVLAGWMAGCSSASNLSEYEKLVARRRAAPAASRPAVQAQPGAKARTPAASAATEKTAPVAGKQAPRAKKTASASARPAAKPAVRTTPPVEAQPVAQEKPVAEVAPASVPSPRPSEAAVSEPEPLPEAVDDLPVAVVAPPEPPAPTPPPPAAEPASAPVPEPVLVPDPAPAPAAAAPRNGAQGVYTLKKGDVVQVVLRGIPEQCMIDDSLDEFGMISLPFLNEVEAEGLTASELEQRIRQLYRDSQIYPNVTVQVQVPTRFYYMQGEVRGPGRVQLVSATRLSQAIAAAGGGTEFWNGKVQLRRNGTIFRKVKDARRLEKYPEDDIFLEAGDIVELMRSWF